MVTKTLTDQMIAGGATLVAQLDKTGVGPAGALWLYESDSGNWKLLMADSRLSRLGPMALYKNLQAVMAAMTEESSDLALDDVSLVTPTHSVVSLLARTVHVEPKSGGARFTNSVFDGTLIEDVYVYRLPSVAPRSRKPVPHRTRSSRKVTIG